MEVMTKAALKGSMHIPSSKSHTLRAILLASLAQGRSSIRLPLHSPDTDQMITACQAFGATIHSNHEEIIVEGVGRPKHINKYLIDAKNSGIVLRFIGAVVAHLDVPVVITGDTATCTLRPCQELLRGLQQLGAFAQSVHQNGYAPFLIRGPIAPGKIGIDGADSQPVSALLIAASLLPGTTEIQIAHGGEKPWLAMTIDWLRRCGVIVESEQSKCIVHGRSFLAPFTYAVPGDASSLAFPLVAALVSESDLVLHNVDLDDVQGDKVLIDILQSMGASFEINSTQKTIRVRGPQQLTGRAIDVNDCIDALPILAVVGCYATGSTHLFNGAVARKKESNRIKAMVQELQKMGARIEERVDGMVIGHSLLKGTSVSSHNDHRVALALAVAGLMATGETTIQQTECIIKTYPNFFSDIRKRARITY